MTTVDKPTSTEAPPLKRDLGAVSLLFASIGSIIGSGWLFGALDAAQIAGPAAIFSWLIGAVMIVIIGLTYAELGTMFPLSGGVIRFPHLSFGSFASYTMGWVNWIAAAAVAPIEVEGALQYATKYAPLTTYDAATDTHPLTGLGYGIAAVAMAVFVLINYFGVRWFARVNNVAVWWKLGVILLVVVAFLVTEFHGSNFTSHGFSYGGVHGMLTAIATSGIIFSFLGFRQGIELAGESSNPKRNVPISVIGSVLITGVIYIALQIAFIAALDPSELSKGWGGLSGQLAEGFGPLAFVASAIGLAWLATILYADAIVSPADTGLVYTTVTGRITYAMAKNKNAPKTLEKTSKQGVPMVGLFVTFVVGLIMFLPFPSWQQLVSFITSATTLSFGSGPLVMAALRRQKPDLPRPFRVPFGDLFPFLAFYASNLVVYWAGWDTNWKLFAAVGLGFVVLAIFMATNSIPKHDMRWRNGATWAVPWLAGLALISYLGDYPDKSEGAGNLATIGFGWGFLAILGLSVIVYALALKVRLTPDEVDANIAEVTAEAAEEDAELGHSS